MSPLLFAVGINGLVAILCVLAYLAFGWVSFMPIPFGLFGRFFSSSPSLRSPAKTGVERRYRDCDPVVLGLIYGIPPVL